MNVNNLGPTPYSDLGVNFHASKAEINAAHGTAMCRITLDGFVPDPTAGEAMNRLWEAMNILGDEHLKRIYDVCFRRVHGIDDPDWPAWRLLSLEKDATEIEAREAFQFYMIIWHNSRYERIPRLAFEHARDRMIVRDRRRRANASQAGPVEEHREAQQAGPERGPERATVPARALQAPMAEARPKPKDPKAPKTAKALKAQKNPNASKALPRTLKEDAKVRKTRGEAKGKKKAKKAEAHAAAQGSSAASAQEQAPKTPAPAAVMQNPDASQIAED